MRKSQAPSLKTRLSPQSTEKNLSPMALNSGPENSFKDKRSTESVLNLLLGLDENNSQENKLPKDSADQLCSSAVYGENRENFELMSRDVNLINNANSSNSFRKLESNVKAYNVVYGKQTKKKHKTWEGDGVLEVGSKYVTLKDENGKIIGKAPCPKARKLEEGVRFYVGSKEVELLDLINGKSETEKDCSTSLVPTEENKKLPIIRKPHVVCKRFQCPRLSYMVGVNLPEPSAEHQWHYNQSGLPISPVYIEETLSKKLRQHQIVGIAFLYECIMGFKATGQTGAILADEMGLGKTLQCIALIWTLLKQGPYGNVPVLKKVLIVAPSSLTMNWYNEFIKWLGRVKLIPFVFSQKSKMSDMRSPVMVISYEMLVRYIEEIDEHKFDLVVCDEGHRLKNSTIKTTHALNRLNCSRRILLTGTPIQNDLQEFYTLVDFVNPNILGTPTEFRRNFAEPILASRQPNASQQVLSKGRECARALKKITATFMLRRTRDILNNYLPPRNDLVVFCKITPVQKKIYNSLIDSFSIDKESNLNEFEGSAHLELITALKKVCNHPSLIKNGNSEKVLNVEDSGKVAVAVDFLKEIKRTSPREKVVIVSNSTKTLDLLENICHSLSYSTCRLDGNTPACRRNRIVEQFNGSHSSSFVFFLSSKAGGVGLNVTGASRLILFDSDWNPAVDLQAISRIWRDGQKFPVYIYRLLTAGTIEEKIYQRQLSKEGLSDGTVDPETSKSIKLSRDELKDIFFPIDLEEDCLTHNALSCHCSKKGEIPIGDVEVEERICQLGQTSSTPVKISELFNWEHHGRPFDMEMLSELCFEASRDRISFIFRTCKI